MPNYTIRPGFNIVLNGALYLGGQSVDLTEAEYQANKHKLEGTESNFKTIGSPRTGKTSGYPAPYISKVIPPKIITGISQTITIEGSFFTLGTVVKVERTTRVSEETSDTASSSGSVEKIQFKSDNELEVVIRATSVVGSYDLIFDNGTQTVAKRAIEFFDIPDGTVDLRLGGTEFSSNAIQVRSNMSFQRTPSGLIFNGQNPMNSWARFVGDDGAWIWNRQQKKTLSWIFKNNGTCMIGIGSQSTNPRTVQYFQAEILCYLVSSTRFSSLFGNNGTPGEGQRQDFEATKARSDTIKAVFTNNGESGGTFTIYRLNSSELKDWFVEDEKLASVSIQEWGADEPNILPFVIPGVGSNSTFLGFILEDEDEL